MWTRSRPPCAGAASVSDAIEIDFFKLLQTAPDAAGRVWDFLEAARVVGRLEVVRGDGLAYTVRVVYWPGAEAIPDRMAWLSSIGVASGCFSAVRSTRKAAA
jgi:hypothetical protein